MKIREIMTSNTGFCGPHTDAAAIAEILWSRDCGAVPVVDERGIVLGIVTDRDLTIALGTRDRRPSSLRADEVMTTDIATCNPDSEVRDALELMTARKVRRLPVVNRAGHLEGMVSIYDIAREATRASSKIGMALVMQAMTRLNDRSAPKESPELVSLRA
jgi:CBS domain-containing protein